MIEIILTNKEIESLETPHRLFGNFSGAQNYIANISNISHDVYQLLISSREKIKIYVKDLMVRKTSGKIPGWCELSDISVVAWGNEMVQINYWSIRWRDKEEMRERLINYVL